MNSFVQDVSRRGVQPEGTGTNVIKGLQTVVVRALDAVLRWQELANQRRALLEFDDRLLKDVGLSRTEALREARRPFWDDPLRQERRPTGDRRVPQRGSPVACCE